LGEPSRESVEEGKKRREIEMETVDAAEDEKEKG
jgi:hypothetical protein